MTSGRRPSINDVARRAGVSKATVSAVINDKGSVGPATRKRVVEVIRELNYRPSNQGARGRRRHPSVGLLIKELDNPYYTEIATGMAAVCRERGYGVLVASSEGDGEAERVAIEMLVEQGVDGLVVTPVMDAEADVSHLFELRRRNVPLVLLEQIRGMKASLVDVDNVEASRRAAEYLIEQGHTRIVHFAGPRYSMHSEERIDGVRRAFGGSALRFSDEAIVAAGAHLEDGYRAGLACFSAGSVADRPTGVTCYNDLVALGLCRALSELGLGVPEDVSVIGFDDLAMLPYLGVPLTTVHVPKAEMGERAAELLIRELESKEAILIERISFDGELVVRGSTRRIQGGDGP